MHRERLIALAEELILFDYPLPLDLVVALLEEGVDVEALEKKARQELREGDDV
jgi:hypothetical protein